MGSNPSGGMDVSVVSGVCCQVEFSRSDRSLLQRSPTKCGVSEYDREASIIRRPWPTSSCCAMGTKIKNKPPSGPFFPFKYLQRTLINANRNEISYRAYRAYKMHDKILKIILKDQENYTRRVAESV